LTPRPEFRGSNSATCPKLRAGRERGRSRALAAARRLGIEVKEVSLPDFPYGARMNIYAEAAVFEEQPLDDADDTLKWQDNGAWPNTFRKARFLSAVDHVQLDRLRYWAMLALDDRGRRVIGPFMTGPMFVPSNFTGRPCLHCARASSTLPRAARPRSGPAS
jgi:hypothetical protein